LLFGAVFHWLWIFAPVPLILAIVAAQWNAKTWPALWNDWNRSYMCERCGWIGPPTSIANAGNGAPPLTYEAAAIPIAQAQPALETEAGVTKLCSHCRSYIPGAATVCRFCQRDVAAT
jgi:ribosomal protein L40E